MLPTSTQFNLLGLHKLTPVCKKTGVCHIEGTTLMTLYNIKGLANDRVCYNIYIDMVDAIMKFPNLSDSMSFEFIPPTRIYIRIISLYITGIKI